MSPKHFIAFDLGATSGRTILGTLRDGELALKELTRFPNASLRLNGHWYWNIYSLYERLCEGLRAAAREQVTISSVGIDTWGVDFAFVGRDGSLLGLPHAYRDPHTDGIPEAYFSEVLSREKVYAATGIQIMPFNSLYQLYALRRGDSSPLAAAHRLLFMPDALSYLLTGEMVTEYTIASTSQLLNPHTKRIEGRLLEGMGLSPELFPPVVMPGHRIGTLHPALAAECGLPELPVIAVAGHETASAVAAVPASDEHFAYLSSGTWSLMGIELPDPVIDERTFACNFTNEGGVGGYDAPAEKHLGNVASGAMPQPLEGRGARLYLSGGRADGFGGRTFPCDDRSGRSVVRRAGRHACGHPGLLRTYRTTAARR